MKKQNTSDALLQRMRDGGSISFMSGAALTVRLSIPAIMAQISSIVMQYIDASMVGQLGAADSASIGLVSTSTWLFGGLCIAAGAGFSVQTAQKIGAGQEKQARSVVRLGLISTLVFSLVLTVIAAAISADLPGWLGGSEEIRAGASRYFLIYMLSLPALQMSSAAGGLLQSSGNMKVPSILNILTCLFDVVFNFFFIFPSSAYTVFGLSVRLPGLGLGVSGAALGTALAEVLCALLMLWFLLFRSSALRLRRGEKTADARCTLASAVKISLPVGAEQIVMCGAMIAATRIVSPLGNSAIAANSFAVTAESLCYMPGYGIASAATTLVGQSIGAGRRELAHKLSWMSVGLGMIVMSAAAVLMYFLAPVMIGMLSPDAEIRALGTDVLRIEAFAEPFYAASIVASGAFRGAGDTLVPSCMNFASMWLVRIPLSAWLAGVMGLRGVWIAMAAELCVRGIIFLVRLFHTTKMQKQS